jgi:tetratricopeptide (TPR) repeat protein/predicted Ser/Thr protein kinase
MSGDPLDRVKRFFSEPDAAPSGRPRIGKYEVLREVARGGMAVVYEARDPDLGRRVALKVLKEGNVERLRREAAAAAKLRHPNVVTVHEVGPDFIVMDFVEGKTLAEALPGLGRAERLRILETVARAVGAAHAQGVVHRDLKPGNVLLEPSGRPVLTDFGLAKIAGGEDLTRTGAVVGTPHYMAPEQVRGEPGRIGPAADVWALGVLLYEVLSDRLPFEGETALAIYEKITREDPPPLPGDLGAVAAKALEKDPARRYPEGGALAEELRRAIAGEPVLARRPGPAGRAWRRAARNPAAFGLGAALVLAAAAAVTLGLAGRAERERAVRALRDTARVSLEAALELRRQGANAGMRKFLPPLESAYREARERAPRLAEVEYLMGRMHRALLENEKALEYQRLALGKDPEYAPAIYESAVLLSTRHGRELKGAYESLLAGQDVPGGVEEIERTRPDLAALREEILGDCRGFLLRAGDRPSPSVSVVRGLLAYHERRYAEAREKLEEAMRLDPLLEEAREALAQVVRAELFPDNESRERAWRRAEELYTQGLAKDAGYVPHYLARGQLRWLRGSRRRHRGMDPTSDYRAAEADFARAVELDAASAEARTWRGQMRVYQALYSIEVGQDPGEHCAAAEEELTEAIRRDPRHAPAWMWRGNARFYRAFWRRERGPEALKDFEEADRDHGEALRVRPGFFDVWRWRGRARAYHASALARAGRDPSKLFEEADENFRRGLPEEERNPWFWGWWSTVGIERGLWRRASGGDPIPDFALAEGQASRGIEVSRDHTESWYYRGMARWHRAECLEASGRGRQAKESYAGAAADFLRAVSINPTLGHQIGDRLERAQKKAADP